MEKIGIVIAMQEEAEKVKNFIEKGVDEEYANLDFTIGKIANKECVIVQSGIGKVNAGRATQALIDHYGVTKIINIGAAASVNDFLDIGDIVVGKFIVQHDFDLTAFGHSKGYITEIGNGVECDKSIISCAEQACRDIEKEIKSKNPRDNFKFKLGVVATGDIFCTDIVMKNKINVKFDADVVDMECGAVAQVAYLSEIPFGAIRSVSDKPNGNNADDFDNNLEKASSMCAEALRKTIELMD